MLSTLGQRLQAFVGSILLFLPGCLSCFHPIDRPPPEQIDQCRAVPHECRSNVTIFLFNGADPLEYGNLSGVRDYLNQIGFAKTYYGQIYHAEWCFEEMKRIRAANPEARFVVIGFDFGAETAKILVQKAALGGIATDLLCYLEPKGIGMETGVAHSKLSRILTIQASRLFGVPTAPVGSETVQLTSTTRYGVPTHPATLARLTEELSRISLQIPITTLLAGPLPPLVEAAPQPRPVEALKITELDEWDFLKLGNQAPIRINDRQP